MKIKRIRRILIALVISILVIFINFNIVTISEIVNGIKNNYGHIELEAYQRINSQDKYGSSIVLDIGFNQNVSRRKLSKNIFIATDIEGEEIIEEININIDLDNSKNVTVELEEMPAEERDYYLFIKEGLTPQNRGYNSLEKTQKIKITTKSSETLEKLGLGKKQIKSVHLDRLYEWYMSQTTTGEYSRNNCGPASATMAIKWVDEGFDKTPRDARQNFLFNGNWWRTNDVRRYLDLYKVDNYNIKLKSENDLKKEIDKGNIAILCLDMSYIRKNYNNPEQHVDLYYSSGTGHFIIVKGYKIVDNQLYFEVYDSWSGELAYEDGESKGKNRYYRGEEIIKAAKEWWKYAIIIRDKKIQ